MIEQVEAYRALCDICGTPCTLAITPASAAAQAELAAWWVTPSPDPANPHAFCPSCKATQQAIREARTP